MVALMNQSIDRLEELADQTNNGFGLNRRGYLFVTAEPQRLSTWAEQANRTSQFGGGPVRTHPGPLQYRPAPAHEYHQQPEGVDIFENGTALREEFPFITEMAVGAIHIRRAGWFSAQQLGSWMLDEAKQSGLSHRQVAVTGIKTDGDAVAGVELSDGASIACDAVVNAAGPMAADIGKMVDLDLPLTSEVHLKVTYRDHRRVVPRDAPMIIWSDPQRVGWSDEERSGLDEIGRQDLLDEMPIFCHGRPEGGEDSDYFLALWEYHDDVREPVWPLPEDDLYPEVVLRGLSTMIPRFAEYRDGLPAASVDGGYYTKTPDNRPLLGPAGPRGFFLACGYSGFGVMVAAGAADLVANHITGSDLPRYAESFLLSRYVDAGYLQSIATTTDDGQL
jgi:glycine/D-amino acid oxidase-like deaminating enzyme